MSMQAEALREVDCPDRKKEMIEQDKESGESSSMSSEETTDYYYYATFDLFNEDQLSFYQYNTFIDRLESELGRDWRVEASRLYRPYATSDDVFLKLLEIWLVNNPAPSLAPSIRHKVYNPNYVEQFKMKMKFHIAPRAPDDFEPGSTNLKAICLGFFSATSDIWNQMFNEKPKQEPAGSSIFSSPGSLFAAPASLFLSPGSIFSSPVSLLPSPSSFLNSALVTNITDRLNSFQPVVVVSKTIDYLMGRKAIKKQEITLPPTPKAKASNQKPNTANIDKNTEDFQLCLYKFTKNYNLQRKLSELEIDVDSNKKMKESRVSLKSFNIQESPFCINMIKRIYKLVAGLLTRQSWEVSEQFVTNSLDLSSFTSLQEGSKVRVLRPAKDFYEKLVVSWLIHLRSQKTADPSTFDAYLQRVLITFGSAWRQKYLVPTKYFFSRICRDWDQIRQSKDQNASNEIILKSLISRIRATMEEDWKECFNRRRKKTKKASN